jgi:hypothetical protein
MPIVFRFNNISFHFHSSFAAFLSLLLQNTPLCFHYEISSQFPYCKESFQGEGMVICICFKGRNADRQSGWSLVLTKEMPLGVVSQGCNAIRYLA